MTKIEFVKPQAHLAKNFKVHPEIDKNAWKDTGVLSADDQETGFTPGSSIDAIIYKLSAEEEVQLPFDLNIFTTKAAGGKQKVSLELEFTENVTNSGLVTQIQPHFKNIVILIKVTDEPKLQKMENSNSDFDKNSGVITWKTDIISNDHENAVLQFYTTTEEDVMFPLKVSYEHENDGDWSTMEGYTLLNKVLE